MTSQMYARYVPVKEKLEVAKDLEASSILLSTQPDASDTYARYIPASKSKSQIPQATDLPSPLSKRTKASHDGEHPVKKKKTKKENCKYTFGRKSLEEAGTPKNNEKPYSPDVLVGIEASSTEKEALSPNLETPIPRNFTDGALKEVNKGLWDSDWEISMDARPADSELEENLAGIAKSGDKKHIKLMKKRDNYLKKVEAIAKAVPDIASDTQEPVELYDLVPLPQPNPVPELPPISSAESLPPWLANPIRVSSTSTAQFEDLGLENDASTILQEKGFREAFAIQSAIIPILLNGVGDVVVSAATGSGKTLAYVLPMIRDLSKYQVSKLRGLIILPTRELVTQAKQVAELCATAFTSNKKVKIGTAVGNETLKVEQSALIDHSYVYDPSAYQRAVEKSNFSWQDCEDMDGGIESIFEENSMCSLCDHVEDYKSKVDVLICTPGRLVEHLKSTLGFSVKDIRWLVVDEADKLLDQSFQQWLPTVMSAIDLRKDILPRSCIRKVILSATMTRDVGQLTQLKLYRPNFVLLESEITANKSEIHVLPPLLLESAIKVEEDGIKPLYLMEVLKRESGLAGLSSDADTPDSDSVSESSSSEPDSDTDQNKHSDSHSDSTTKAESSQHLEPPPRSFKSPKLPIPSSSSRGVLIFTKSNETAVRLGRLIALLSPDLTSHIGLLTSILPRASRQRTLQAFGKGNISLLVASDLVSRGLDLANLAHVVNYDMPSSLTSYIHRIGRTARAGKTGHAWTLFTATEGRWFWNEIGRSPNVVRPSGKVERLNIKKEIFDQEKRRVYEGALEILEKEATGHAARK